MKVPKPSSSTNEDNSNPPKSSSSAGEDDSNPSWNTTFPPPPAGVFNDREQLKQHLDTHSIPHGYKISVLDTRPLYVDFKCAKGPTRYSNSRGTCPFFAQATRSSIEGPWTLETHEPRHDHQPFTNQNQPQDRSQNQIKQIKRNIKSNKSRTRSTLSQEYKDHISSLKKLDYSKQKTLLQTFKKAIEDAKSSSNPESPKADLEDEEEDYEIQMQLTPHSKAKRSKSKKIILATTDSEEDKEEDDFKSKLWVTDATKEAPPVIDSAKEPLEQPLVPTTTNTNRQSTLSSPSVMKSKEEQPNKSAISKPHATNETESKPPVTDADRQSSRDSSPFPTPSIPDLISASHEPTVINEIKPNSCSSPLPPALISELVILSPKTKSKPLVLSPTKSHATTSATTKANRKTRQKLDQIKPPLPHKTHAKRGNQGKVIIKKPPVIPSRSSARLQHNKSHKDPAVQQSKNTKQGTSEKAVPSICKAPSSVGESEVDTQKSPKKDSILERIPLADQIPSYLHPFLLSATNVKGDGLCSFSSIAICLGRTKDDAVKIRSEMAVELVSNYDWYHEHLPGLCPGYDLDRFLEILQNPSITASKKYWYPMPGGSVLIANTFHQPVMYYTSQVSLTSTTFPFFTSPTSKIKPIVISFVNKNHYVPLELKFCNDLPIPLVCSDWATLHNEAANAWTGMYSQNCMIFNQIAKEIRAECRKLDDQKPPNPNPQYVSIDISSPLTSESSSSSSSSSSESD